MTIGSGVTRTLEPVKKASNWLWTAAGLVVVGVILLLWCVGVFGWFYVQDGATTTACGGGTREILLENSDGRVAGPPEGETDERAVLTTEDDAPVTFDFTSRRDAQTQTIPFAIQGTLPEDLDGIEVVIEGFDGAGGTPGIDSVYDLRPVGSRLVLDICIDSRELKVTSATDTVERKAAPGFGEWLWGTFDTRPGTYTTDVHLVHEGISSEPIPVTVRFQGRYVWLLAPLVLLMPAVAIWVVYQGRPQKWGLVYLPTLGATALAFNAQALSDPDWGGWLSVFGLIGATFSAGIAAATLAARSPGTPTLTPDVTPDPAPDQPVENEDAG